MKQVNLVAALLLFALGASAQTVTPDPGPYAPMNQKYEYRWIKTSGGIWNLGKLVVQDSTDLRSVTYVTTAPDNDSSKRVASTAWVKKNIAAGGGGGGIDSVRRKGVTDTIVEFYGGALGFRRFAFITPATSGSDTTGTGNLYIRNITTQENKGFNVKGGRLDTLYASTSAGGRIVSNSGSVAAEWGVGGGRNFDFHGFAGYNLNRASSYTTRSFTDKNYVDSSLTLKTTVTSYGKNAGGDSTILVLGNGTRYAAKDSVGGGGGWGLTGNASAVTDFLGTTNNRTMRFRTNNTERMVIDSTGSVGIGTSTNAGYKLDVFGPVRLYPRGAFNGGFEFTNTDVYNIMHSNTYTYLSSNNAMFIGGVGITLIGTNKNESQSQLGLGYQSWQTNLMSGSAKFDIRSTTQGFLMPRMTTVQRDAIATPATGLQVFNTTNNTPNYYTGTSWANMGGSVYKTAVQEIGTSENLVSAKIRPVKRLIFRGSTGASGTVQISLTGYSPELILSLTGTFVLDANFTVPLPYSDFSYVDGDITTTNVKISYRPSLNVIQIDAINTYAGSSSAINSSYVAIIEFQEN